jgi:hypothetical protein
VTDSRTNAELAKAVEGLRNLRDGYSLAFACGYYKREHGFDVIEELASAVARAEEADRLARELEAAQQELAEAKALAERSAGGGVCWWWGPLT